MVSEFLNMPETGWHKDAYQKMEKASVKNTHFHVHFCNTLQVFTQKPLIHKSEVYYYQSQKQQTKNAEILCTVLQSEDFKTSVGSSSYFTGKWFYWEYVDHLAK